jgi:cytochrome c-type biogenesis protein CcsB
MVDQLGWVSSMAVASAAVMLGVTWFCHLFGRVFRRPVARPAERPMLVTAGAPAEPVSTGPIDAPEDDRSVLPDRLGRSFAHLAGAFLVIGCVVRGIAAGRVPWGNMYEFAITGTAALVIAYLIIDRRRPQLRLGTVVPAVAVIILGLAMIVYVPVAPLVPALRSYWLVLHVLAAALSGASFILTGVISLRYLVDTRRGRKRNPATAEDLDRLAFRLIAFAFPIWTFGALIAGPIWAEYAWGRYWGWDPKEVWALVTWIVFAAYLHARATAGWRGRRAAVLAIVGAASFIFNYIGVNLFFSGLHSYAGI